MEGGELDDMQLGVGSSDGKEEKKRRGGARKNAGRSKVGQQPRQVEQEVTMALHLQRKPSLRREPRTSRRNSARVAIEPFLASHFHQVQRIARKTAEQCRTSPTHANSVGNLHGGRRCELIQSSSAVCSSGTTCPTRRPPHSKRSSKNMDGVLQFLQASCFSSYVGGTNGSNLCLDSLSACDLDFFG